MCSQRITFMFYVLVDLIVYPAWLDFKLSMVCFLHIRCLVTQLLEKPRSSYDNLLSMIVVRDQLAATCEHLPIGGSRMLDLCVYLLLNKNV